MSFDPYPDEYLRQLKAEYVISWLGYDPTKEIAKLRSRILIVQGTTDLQVRLADAKGLADSNPKARLLIIDGMNHVLKTVPSEQDKQVASYSDPTLRLAPALVSAITRFVVPTNASSL